MLSRSVRSEVDPLAVPGKAGNPIVGRMRSDATGLSARSGDHINVELASKDGVERDRLAVRRPAGGACDFSAHGRELDSVGPVKIGQPDFKSPRAIRGKGNPAGIG